MYHLENYLLFSFMKKYTSFSTLDDLLKAGGFNVESEEDFESI